MIGDFAVEKQKVEGSPVLQVSKVLSFSLLFFDRNSNSYEDRDTKEIQYRFKSGRSGSIDMDKYKSKYIKIEDTSMMNFVEKIKWNIVI